MRNLCDYVFCTNYERIPTTTDTDEDIEYLWINQESRVAKERSKATLGHIERLHRKGKLSRDGTSL